MILKTSIRYKRMKKIKIENIGGRLLIIGAEDDALWNTAKYIRKRDERLKEQNHSCTYKCLIYPHVSRFVFPQGRIQKRLLIGSTPFCSLCFKKARDYAKESKKTRIDIDRAWSEENSFLPYELGFSFKFFFFPSSLK